VLQPCRSNPDNVRYGSLADIAGFSGDVGYVPEADISLGHDPAEAMEAIELEQ
jgi:hypothetical protein